MAGTILYWLKNNNFPFHQSVYFYLPDFLWMFSGLNLFALIWGHEKISLLFYQSLFYSAALLLEVLQHISSIPGTFDILDILVYSSAFIFNLTYLNFKLKQFYEKPKQTFD